MPPVGGRSKVEGMSPVDTETMTGWLEGPGLWSALACTSMATPTKEPRMTLRDEDMVTTTRPTATTPVPTDADGTDTPMDPLGTDADGTDATGTDADGGDVSGTDADGQDK